MSSPLEEPFILPVERDFAPRELLRRKYGYMALDEVALANLLDNDLEKVVLFHTTYTIVDYEILKTDRFALRLKDNVCEVKDVASFND